VSSGSGKTVSRSQRRAAGWLPRRSRTTTSARIAASAAPRSRRPRVPALPGDGASPAWPAVRARQPRARPRIVPRWIRRRAGTWRRRRYWPRSVTAPASPQRGLRKSRQRSCRPSSSTAGSSPATSTRRSRDIDLHNQIGDLDAAIDSLRDRRAPATLTGASAWSMLRRTD
jgi:hypothetical protein